MSVAPDDSVWRGRAFDAGLVLHRETGSSRDCSAAWAADIVQRVSREGAAASDAASLAHVEGGLRTFAEELLAIHTKTYNHTRCSSCPCSNCRAERHWAALQQLENPSAVS